MCGVGAAKVVDNQRRWTRCGGTRENSSRHCHRGVLLEQLDDWQSHVSITVNIHFSSHLRIFASDSVGLIGMSCTLWGSYMPIQWLLSYHNACFCEALSGRVLLRYLPYSNTCYIIGLCCSTISMYVISYLPSTQYSLVLCSGSP